MLNRRGLLKLIVLAPVAAPAIVAAAEAPRYGFGQMSAGFPLPADYVADLSEYTWVRQIDLEAGETMSYLEHHAPAVGRIAGTLIHDPRLPVSAEPAGLAYSPYHAEMMAV
jgi:hypothetical protein